MYVLLFYRDAFRAAYRMLAANPRTNCQQFVIWVSDEEHGDNDVRCEPGHYEYDGENYYYVPGRLCDWVDTYENLIGIVEANTRNTNVSV